MSKGLSGADRRVMMDPGERSDRQSRWFVFWMFLMILGVCSMVIALILFAMEHPASATKHWSGDIASVVALLSYDPIAAALRGVSVLSVMLGGLILAVSLVYIGAMVVAQVMIGHKGRR
jgi:hypothetical protein